MSPPGASGRHVHRPQDRSSYAARTMTHLDPRSIEIAERTDIGMLRETNQDACRYADVAGYGRVLCVADGMGGHAGGEVASALAVETVTGQLGIGASGDPAQALEAVFRAAHGHIRDEAERRPELGGMGTTGVALLFVPDAKVHVAHVGDSRAYLLRGGEIEQLTEDHSLVAELVRRGAMNTAQARVHPRRNELTRCLGVREALEIELGCRNVEPGDLYLLCSDGLCGVLTDEEILRIVRYAEPRVAVERLVSTANVRGGPDNITVQIALVPES